MPSYTIYEKPGLPVEQAIDSAVMVKQQHSMLAFFLPVVWILVKRLWIVLFAYLIISSAAVTLETILPIWASMLVTLLMSLWISVEAPNLIGWTLQRNGYVEVGSLFAEDRDHCERRYVEARSKDPRSGGLPPEATPPARSSASRTSTALSGLGRSVAAEPVLGLFPSPAPSEEKR
ncbi:Protein of unknown function [Cohaesibacter sp. ES.047]|uniref:DUF2628 domain-containing protein n=1 Tax=Cohaesibacter sp. ES.047 TaxID=1798205 RepID=UPI000BBF42B6|nr:DUF2628 domain-containing protein [Cohaesibacter sp. ES.047]SNY90504.1 Protein of unknown function [Cohaesibacter sp. ES.047]